MKRIYFLFVFVITFQACDTSFLDSKTIVSPSPYSDNTEIINRFQEYNKSLAKLPRKRNWGTWYATLSADALAVIPAYRTCVGVAALATALSGGTAGVPAGIGVLAGTAFLAGGASYGMYRSCSGCSIISTQEVFLNTTYSNKNNINKIKRFYSKINDRGIISNLGDHELKICNDSIYSYIGQLHNEILTTIDSLESNAEYEPIEEPEQIELINKPHNNLMSGEFLDNDNDRSSDFYDLDLNSYGLTVYSNSEVDSMVTDINNKMVEYYTNVDKTDILELFVENNYLSMNAKNILFLFFDAVENSVCTINDMNSIVNNYITMINISNQLSCEEKQICQMCIEMAKYSYLYWGEHEKEFSKH